MKAGGTLKINLRPEDEERQEFVLSYPNPITLNVASLYLQLPSSTLFSPPKIRNICSLLLVVVQRRRWPNGRRQKFEDFALSMSKEMLKTAPLGRLHATKSRQNGRQCSAAQASASGVLIGYQFLPLITVYNFDIWAHKCSQLFGLLSVERAIKCVN